MPSLSERIIDWGLNHPKTVTWLMVGATIVCAAFIPLIRVDTDPENMLSADEPVRVFDRLTKKEFDLSDIVVVGVINEKHPHGVFNAATLNRVYQLTEFAKTLRWPDKEHPDKMAGVIEVDMIAPSLVDHIQHSQPGVVSFQWLMPQPPADDAEALAVRDKIMTNPLLVGTLISQDSKALCLYLPLTDKKYSYKVYKALQRQIKQLGGEEEYHITGLPVAEDTFGVEMFIQMAISAPLAMLTIFILKWIFFRKIVLILSPMIIALVSVITTMGLLIGFGYPVHIMSSMIPIFLMPIAVVDSVHILSEFFDRYTPAKGRRQTIKEVMSALFVSMLYTSLTSAAGFLSLALTPIPPVQVFGVFVAVGVMIAWVVTVTFVPAYVMMLPDSTLKNFGLSAQPHAQSTVLTRILAYMGGWTVRFAKPILLACAVAAALSVYGISRIQINDNPVKWFSKRHPIRIADTALNSHFAGTYMAYLVLEQTEQATVDKPFVQRIVEQIDQKVNDLQSDWPASQTIGTAVKNHIDHLARHHTSRRLFLEDLSQWLSQQAASADANDGFIWDEITAIAGVELEQLNIFKRPDVLNYMVGLQDHLLQAGVIGKSSSVADIVRKVNQELIDGKPENYRIPDTLGGVAECYLQYQQSHRPQDLWHLVTPDFQKAVIWIQLPSGDNKDMMRAVRQAETYMAEHQPPMPLTAQWAGLTYINVVWQDKMVWGMLQSFLGSFLVVFIMMAILFRSVVWGLLCMVPLTITILGIYGFIGFIGKDYDMPVAVLSALTLGMAVDFAIHFLQRSRQMHSPDADWRHTAAEMFGEPARAISRNVLVIAIGFLPLLAAPLVPYKTVGIFLCAIMALSGVVTLLILPAAVAVLQKHLFKPAAAIMPASCNCIFCFVVSASAVVLIALNLHQYWQMGLTRLTLISICLLPLLLAGCAIAARRKVCKMNEQNQT